MTILVKLISLWMSLMLTITGWFGTMPLHTLQVNKTETYQTNEGFGTSAAWWAQNVDDEAEAERIAELLYSKEKGLGLDVYRYNVGAGEKENPASIIAIESRKTESFWVKNDATGEYEFDFTRDANAVRMMDLAVKYGASKIVLFCNSPHFSLTENGLGSGSTEEGRCNLPPENYGAFVDYLLTVAEHFVEEGYPVYAISPINEPQWNWGTGWVSQEGCHYSPDEAVALLECFALEMQERNEPFKLLGPESGQMGFDSKEYEEKFYESEILRNYCDTYSGHSYWLDGNTAEKQATGERFAQNYPGLKFEMSEWCELPLSIDSSTIESGLRMANVIFEDLTLMNAVSWQSWTAVNGDGMLDYKDDSLTTYKRYFVMKQFSIIPMGAVRMGVLDSHLEKTTLKTLAYSDDQADYLVIINDGEEAQNVSLTGVYSHKTIYVTSADHDCEMVASGSILRKAEILPKSITTIVMTKKPSC